MYDPRRCLLLAALALAGCGSGEGGDPGAPIITLSRDTVAFTARAGAPDAMTVQVAVTNSGDAPLNGIAVRSITHEPANPAWLTATLDQPDAPATLTLTASVAALTAGSYRADVTVGTASLSRHVIVNLAVEDAVAASLSVLQPPAPQGIAGGRLPDSVAVRALDANGAPVAGVTVAFAVLAGGGSVSPASVVTDAGGIARTDWTLGTVAMENRLRATAGILATPDMITSGTAGPASRLAFQALPATVAPGDMLAPVVEVLDQYGNRVVGDGAVVTLTLESASVASTRGARTATVAAGLATFQDLSAFGPLGRIVLEATSPGLTGAVSPEIQVVPPARSTTDRPDDVSGPQLHVVYAIPSDGTDRQLDGLVTLHHSIASFQSWLRGKTGGRQLILDTHHGVIDITFLQMSDTDAAMAGGPLDFVINALEGAGLNHPSKTYLVYYDGTGGACGGALWPGKVVAMYLKGLQGTPSACGNQPFVSAPDQFPGYWEFATLHDVLHTQGVVDVNAPHGNNAHVPEPIDLMYSGPAPWEIGPLLVLDLGGDDYWGPLVPAGIANLADSPLLGPVTSGFRALRQDGAFRLPAPRSTTLLPPVHGPGIER